MAEPRRYNPGFLSGNNKPRQQVRPNDQATKSSFDAVCDHFIEISSKPGGARMVNTALTMIAKSPNAGAAEAYQQRLKAAGQSLTPNGPSK